jgi:hypothetical protein
MYAVIDKDMRIDQFAFGSIRIDGVVYEHDVVIARGQIRKRKKKTSRPFRDAFGHTPLSVKEDIPPGLPAASGGHRGGRRLARDGRGQG